MGKKPGNFWADSIGHGLAHVQDAIDDVSKWGFQKMRSAGENKTPKKQKNENKYIYGAKKLGKTSLGFLGNIGDAFYDKYSDLKKDDKEE